MTVWVVTHGNWSKLMDFYEKRFKALFSEKSLAVALAGFFNQD